MVATKSHVLYLIVILMPLCCQSLASSPTSESDLLDGWILSIVILCSTHGLACHRDSLNISVMVFKHSNLASSVRPYARLHRDSPTLHYRRRNHVGCTIFNALDMLPFSSVLIHMLYTAYQCRASTMRWNRSGSSCLCEQVIIPACRYGRNDSFS